MARMVNPPNDDPIGEIKIVSDFLPKPKDLVLKDDTEITMTTDFIEIQWTSGSIDEARKVCRYLVQERLAACAQIIPWIESIYIWNNLLETAQESKITLKARLADFETIKQVILDNCKYEVPEITYSTIEGGHQVYLDWLAESTAAVQSS